MLFDIVIPVGPNDEPIIRHQINYTKKNIIGYRNIYLVCKDETIIIDGCITISEKIFPFQITDILGYLDNNGYISGWNRTGWYLQQLIKLYSGFIIPDILSSYLVIDSDTFFLKPTSFFEGDIPLYAHGTEHHLPYFNHMQKLNKNFLKVINISGICHHMIFQKNIIEEIFNLVELSFNLPFWKAFMQCIDKNELSGASEYEIYFNYILKNYNDKIKLRNLSWKNDTDFVDYTNFSYISIHQYNRQSKLNFPSL
jgi:hypothetical protein